MNVGWPEGFILAIMVFNLLATAVLDGKPRTGKFSFPLTLCSAAISFALLYWGGFFA